MNLLERGLDIIWNHHKSTSEDSEIIDETDFVVKNHQIETISKKILNLK